MPVTASTRATLITRISDKKIREASRKNSMMKVHATATVFSFEQDLHELIHFRFYLLKKKKPQKLLTGKYKNSLPDQQVLPPCKKASIFAY